MPTYIIVDDERLIRKGFEKLLGRLEPDWSNGGEAENGIEALELIASVQPDLIFTDVRMPEMDGIELAERLAAQGNSIPVVFFTGFDDFEFVQKAIRHNAFDYLLKPLREADIKQLFERYAREFRPPNRPLGAEVAAKFEQYAFELTNALAAAPTVAAVEAVVRTHYAELSGVIGLRSFLEWTCRIVDRHYAETGFLGFEYKPVVLPTDIEAILQKLAEAVFQHARRAAEREDGNKIVELAKRYIDERLHESITLDSVARIVHMHTTYFSEYFKKHTGETFIAYVTRRRMERAKRLLRDPLLKIGDVAESVGYRNHRHFGRVFKAVVGVAPSEYRDGSA